MAVSENTVSLEEIAEAQAQLFQLATGFWGARALHVALSLDVFGQLEKDAMTGPAMAQALNADGGGIEALLTALSSLGLVEKDARGYGNSAVTRLFLLPSSPYYQGSLIQGYAAEWAKWQQLETVLKHGPPTMVARRGFSPDAFQARVNLASVIAPLAAQKLDLRRVHKVLDLGGCAGAFATELCRARPDLTAVVLDLEPALALTRDRLAAAGLAERVTTKAGDCLETVLGASEFDLVIISDVLRTQPAARSKELLERAFDALVSEGQSVVCDVLLDDDRQGPLPSALLALETLLTTPAGPACSTWDVTDMMQGVGFIRLQTIPLEPSHHGLVVGYHP